LRLPSRSHDKSDRQRRAELRLAKLELAGRWQAQLFDFGRPAPRSRCPHGWVCSSTARFVYLYAVTGLRAARRSPDPTDGAHRRRRRRRRRRIPGWNPFFL